jgi:hypothetical protein
MLRWTIVPRDYPRPVFACATCGADRPFQPSGKIRLNANGKRLDAWLIYKCAECDRTWNRPIFERRLASDIPADDLAALRAGDPAYVRRLAFDLDALRRKTAVIEQSDAVNVEKVTLAAPAGWSVLDIAFVLPEPVGLRLDRLLAGELGITRSRIATLDLGKRLALSAGASLKRPPRDGLRITLDLAGIDDREAIAMAASR